MATMNVSLSDELKDWAEEQVASGAFSNVSDYVRSLVREHRGREIAFAELRQLAKEGLASGLAPQRTREQMLEDARAKYRATLKKRRAV